MMVKYSSIINIAAEAARNAAFITGLVVVMLLLVEYASAVLSGRLRLLMGKSAAMQIVAAALLGAAPGCVGGFAVVSLYVQGSAGIGALCAALTATMGDEALVMLSLFPRHALMIQACLLVVAIVLGFCVNKYAVYTKCVKTTLHTTAHVHACSHHIHTNIWQNLRYISLLRALLLLGLMLALAAVAGGAVGHSHGQHLEHGSGSFFDEGWINVVFAVLLGMALVVALAAAPHFLREHWWRHVIRRHLLKVFLWSYGALALAAALEHFMAAQALLGANQWLLLGAAIVLGIIPVSGPHLAFVALYANGSVGLPVLFASMLVQDGHAGLPLLASSKRTFLFTKIIKILIAIIVGIMLI
jgi:hypothetical protein